jgi:hypothetical protein
MLSYIVGSVPAMIERALPSSSSDEAVMAAVERVVVSLNDIDEEHGAIETGEREELCEYIVMRPGGRRGGRGRAGRAARCRPLGPDRRLAGLVIVSIGSAGCPPRCL